MKRILLIFVVLIALAAVLWFGGSWVANGGWPASGATGEPLPPHIQYVKPADGEAAEQVYRVCVHFDYLAGRGMGDAPEESIRLFLDGRNATRGIVDLVRLEYPDATGEPCFTGAEPLRPGWHTTLVTYQDVSGAEYAYKWRFLVVEEE